MVKRRTMFSRNRRSRGAAEIVGGIHVGEQLEVVGVDTMADAVVMMALRDDRIIGMTGRISRRLLLRRLQAHCILHGRLRGSRRSNLLTLLSKEQRSLLISDYACYLSSVITFRYLMNTS